MSEITTIVATASVILNLCEGTGDPRTKFKRIAYAAAVINRETIRALANIDSVVEVPLTGLPIQATLQDAVLEQFDFPEGANHG